MNNQHSGEGADGLPRHDGTLAKSRGDALAVRQTSTANNQPRVGGGKRSSWQTLRRCLVIMRRLMHGPATSSELIADAKTELGKAFSKNPKAALRQDLGRLRRDFGCVIRYHHGSYHMVKPPRQSLLDLPNAHVETLAFLQTFFASGGLPHAAEVRALVEYITALLPKDRQEHITRRTQHGLGYAKDAE